jgi:hypothetical protein
VKKAIKNGTAKPCFCVDLVRAQDEENFSDALAGYVSGSLLEAGSDTTAATLIGCKKTPSTSQPKKEFPCMSTNSYPSKKSSKQ